MADASYMYLASSGRMRSPRMRSWAAIDYTAAHEYDYQEFIANPDMYDDRLRAMNATSAGKPFLATEICVNDPHYQEPSYRIAFNIAQLYQKNLTELDATALMYCWLLLDIEHPPSAARVPCSCRTVPAVKSRSRRASSCARSERSAATS